MIYVISRLFNTFIFIFIQVSCSTTIMRASALLLNELIAIIAFDSRFKSLNVSLSFFNMSNEDLKNFLPFSRQLEEHSCVSGIAK